MILIIHRGKHRPSGWIRQLRVWFNKKSISRRVSFYSSCAYDLKGDDQADVNKLFGLGYLWNKKDSARFGWNYSLITGKINIYAYVHLSGVVSFNKVCDVPMGAPTRMTIYINDHSYFFSVTNYAGKEVASTSIDKPHKKKLSYALGLYFGGNRVAPQDIKVMIE